MHSQIGAECRLHRVILDDHLFDIPLANLQQIGLNPILELGGERFGIDVNCINTVLTGQPYEPQFITTFYLLSYNHTGQIVALFVLHKNHHPNTRVARLDLLLIRLKDSERPMIGWHLAGDIGYSQADQTGRRIAYLVLRIGGIVLMRRYGPSTVCILLHGKLSNFAELFVEFHNRQTAGRQRVVKIIEQFFTNFFARFDTGWRRPGKDRQQADDASGNHNNNRFRNFVHSKNPGSRISDGGVTSDKSDTSSISDPLTLEHSSTRFFSIISSAPWRHLPAPASDGIQRQCILPVAAE